MNANELRIGNLVKYHHSGRTIEVKEISKHSINLGITNEKGVREEPFIFEELLPIQLTEEILLKCGFVFNQYYDHMALNMFDIMPTDEGFMLTINGYEYETDCVVKYLHQLQNLYFALSGKELEINL